MSNIMGVLNGDKAWCADAASSKSILLDASARRFRVQKIYVRAVAAARWINARNQILQGQKPNASHVAALQLAENKLRAVGLSLGVQE